MIIPNRHVMYKRYTDGIITESEYLTYLVEQEERERQASENFENIVRRMGERQ